MTRGPTATPGQAGFSLVELLTIIAILGILGTIGFQVYSRGISQTQVNEATAQLAGALKRARSQAQLTGANYRFSWTASPFTSYSVTNLATDKGTTESFNSRVTVTCATGCTTQEVIYQAPFGELGSGASSPVFEISSRKPGIHSRKIQLVGVTGKVVIKAD